MFHFHALFAFCDLHATRWPLRRAEFQKRLDTDGVSAALHVLGPMFYDRQGFPLPGTHFPDGTSDLGALAFARLGEQPGYNRVGWDELPDGSYLSTVWLGIDHSLGHGPPMLFETMRFRETGRTNAFLGVPERDTLEFPDPAADEMITQLRYMTEEEAAAAHHEIVRRIRVREGH